MYASGELGMIGKFTEAFPLLEKPTKYFTVAVTNEDLPCYPFNAWVR